MLTTAQCAEAFWNAYNAHDVDAILSLVDDDIVVRFPLSAEPIAGKDNMSAIWSAIFHQFVPDIRQEVLMRIIGESSAAFALIETGTLRLPGVAGTPGANAPRRYENRVAAFLSTNEAGQISTIDFYWDTAAFARQLSLDADALREFRHQVISLGEWVGRTTLPLDDSTGASSGTPSSDNNG